MADAARIAANVARLRLERRLTQDQLAARAGISRMALGKIERGTVVPRARTLADLAAALAAPVGELVTPGEPAGLPGTISRRTACRGSCGGRSKNSASRSGAPRRSWD